MMKNTILLGSMLRKRKSTVIIRKNVDNHVDNVDKLLTKQGFAHNYDISCTHSYQQITVHTIL